ncbi:MAG: CueP family metal-binding protein [Nocardioides sp.]|nr:CueP family metal-binding protein [Nocardioides sp.]
MRKTLTTRVVVGATVALAMMLAGCATQTDDQGSAAPSSAAPDPVPAPEDTEALLAEWDLDGMTTVEIIDHLERLAAAERPTDLMASVRPGDLMISADTGELSLDVPEDRFYLSVAPYVDQTHECFYHSLTTCLGELDSAEVQVQIVDETNDEVLVDETRTTFDNGFTGFWLPRDIEGTLRVTYDGKTGSTRFTTDQDAPTCLTTLQLA